MSSRGLPLLILLLGGVPVAVADEPLPAPGDDTRQAVISLLRENRQRYGDDAAIMQGLLLVHANAGGAVLATESAIVGFEERDARRFVAFRVDSGTVFDDGSTMPADRVALVWREILERSLRRYPTFDVPGDGIAVEILYSHRPFGSLSELYQTLDQPRIVEHAKFYLLSRDIKEFLAQRLGPGELLSRSVVLLDEKPIGVTVTDFVGPPDPADAAGLFP